MSGRAMSCEHAQESFGVLVLGAIDPIERDEVEEHIFGCSTCPAVLAEFSSLPGLLKRLDADRVGPDGPPGELLDRILAQVRTEQAGRSPRRVAWVRPVAALVAVAAVALAVLAVVISRPDDPVSVPSPNVVSAASDPASGVSASLTMSPAEVGTQLHVSVNGVVPGEHCVIVVVGKDGSREVAASWVAGYVGAAQVTGTTGFAAEEIARIDITTPDGSRLVTVPVST